MQIPNSFKPRTLRPETSFTWKTYLQPINLELFVETLHLQPLLGKFCSSSGSFISELPEPLGSSRLGSPNQSYDPKRSAVGGKTRRSLPSLLFLTLSLLALSHFSPPLLLLLSKSKNYSPEWKCSEFSVSDGNCAWPLGLSARHMPLSSQATK